MFLFHAILQVNWYSEVLELRKLAQQFKAKSHGSHFSPDKLGQIAYSRAQLRDSEPTVETNGKKVIAN